jgi:hypothetical protein
MHAGALFLVVGFKSWFEFEFGCCLNKFANRNLKKKRERNPNHRSSPACFPYRPSAGPPNPLRSPVAALADRRTPPVSVLQPTAAIGPLRLTRGTRVSSPSSRPSPTRTPRAPRPAGFASGPPPEPGPRCQRPRRPYLLRLHPLLRRLARNPSNSRARRRQRRNPNRPPRSSSAVAASPSP